MKRITILAGALCVLALALAVSAQDTPKVTGTWDIRIDNPKGAITEQWMLQQDGDKLTGKVKNAQGDLPLDGTLEGSTLRIDVTAGDTPYEVHATVVGDSMDGTVRMGKNEFLWRASRAKSK